MTRLSCDIIRQDVIDDVTTPATRSTNSVNGTVRCNDEMFTTTTKACKWDVWCRDRDETEAFK